MLRRRAVMLPLNDVAFEAPDKIHHLIEFVLRHVELFHIVVRCFSNAALVFVDSHSFVRSLHIVAKVEGRAARRGRDEVDR